MSTQLSNPAPTGIKKAAPPNTLNLAPLLHHTIRSQRAPDEATMTMKTIKPHADTGSAADQVLRRHIQSALDHYTLLWWAALSSIALVNISVWVCTYRALADATAIAANHPYQRHHLTLSGIYVFVCAYRSFLPRIDLERYCLFDTFASSIFLGRLAATIAEIAFSAQIALFLYHVGSVYDHVMMQYLALVLVPVIAMAQCFCWCGVVTLNHAYHAIEESIWAVSSVFVGAAMGSLALYHPDNASLWYIGVIGSLSSFIFFAFMVTVDVPMYIRRWRENKRVAVEKGKRQLVYMNSFEGGKDALSRRVVTKSWDIWREESVWLTGYFSSAVWLSLLMVHLPAP